MILLLLQFYSGWLVCSSKNCILYYFFYTEELSHKISYAPGPEVGDFAVIKLPFEQLGLIFTPVRNRYNFSHWYENEFGEEKKRN